MRAHIRTLIDEARQEAGSRTTGRDTTPTPTITEQLGADVVRLAHLATAMHMQEAARHDHRAMTDTDDTRHVRGTTLAATIREFER